MLSLSLSLTSSTNCPVISVMPRGCSVLTTLEAPEDVQVEGADVALRTTTTSSSEMILYSTPLSIHVNYFPGHTCSTSTAC